MLNGGRRPDRYGEDHPGSTEVLERPGGGADGSPGCEPIVDEDHQPVGYLYRRTVTPVCVHPSLELLVLRVDGPLQLLPGDFELTHQRLVEEQNAPFGDGAHAELRLARRTELAHHEDVEIGAKLRSNLGGDYDPSARQADDQGGPVAIFGEGGGKAPTRVATIAKDGTVHETGLLAGKLADVFVLVKNQVQPVPTVRTGIGNRVAWFKRIVRGPVCQEMSRPTALDTGDGLCRLHW